MLGFPIRTPSDHSSVDSSPRLIAAYHVLHRLLVPRHPPYALNYLQKRCSRPLCNSQTTHKTRTHCSTSHPPKETRYDHNPDPAYSCLEKTLTCSLRTQQYADIDTAEQSLKTPRYAMSDCQCSTRELPPFHMWERNGLCHTIIY